MTSKPPAQHLPTSGSPHLGSPWPTAPTGSAGQHRHLVGSAVGSQPRCVLRDPRPRGARAQQGLARQPRRREPASERAGDLAVSFAGYAMKDQRETPWKKGSRNEGKTLFSRPPKFYWLGSSLVSIHMSTCYLHSLRQSDHTRKVLYQSVTGGTHFALAGACLDYL